MVEDKARGEQPARHPPSLRTRKALGSRAQQSRGQLGQEGFPNFSCLRGSCLSFLVSSLFLKPATASWWILHLPDPRDMPLPRLRQPVSPGPSFCPTPSWLGGFLLSLGGDDLLHPGTKMGSWWLAGKRQPCVFPPFSSKPSTRPVGLPGTCTGLLGALGGWYR